MTIVAPPNPESRDIAKWFTDHEQRIKRVETGLRTAQLGNSSLNGNGLDMFDANGNYRGTIGFQGDGNTTVTSVNPLPPPVPGAPSVTPGLAHLLVTHSGETATGTGNPSDFSHLKVYTATTGLPEIRTFRGAISPVPGEFPVTDLDYAAYLVTVTGVNLSGKESAHSVPTSGTPQQAVSADLIAGIVQETHLSGDIVAAAHIKANAVTATKIAPESIETPHLTVGAVVASKIAANQIDAGHLTAGSVTTAKILALNITADTIATNAITAGKILAGSVTATKLEANMVIANRIIAGTATGARVEMHPTLGLQAYQSNGTTRTFWINSSTGEAFFMGEIETAVSGSRIVLNPGGTIPDEMRFHQGVNYGYINAEAAPGGTAAVVGRSQIVSGRLAAFGCYPTEAFIAYQTFSPAVSLSACSTIDGAANIWSNGSINLDVRNTNGRVDFTNSVSTAMRLEYRKSGVNNEPQLYNPARDIAVTWASQFIYIGNGAGAGKDLVALNLAGSSSREGKKGEREPVLSMATSARDAASRIRVKQFNYNHERVESDPVPVMKPARRKRTRTDISGHVVIDPDTNKPIEDEELIELVVPEIVKPHFGAMAEDLLAVLPEVIRPNSMLPGGLAIIWNDLIGYLLMTNTEQEQELRALRSELDVVKEKVK